MCDCGGGDEPDPLYRSRRGVDKPKLQRLFSRMKQDEGVVGRPNPGYISQTSYYGDNSMSIPQP